MTEFTPRLLADYQAPRFTIDKIDLTFELDDCATLVRSELSIMRQGVHHHPLVLDGEQLTLESVLIDGQPLAAQNYQQTAEQLTIPTELMHFTLTITTQINPQQNTALEGLFKSGTAFCTQCEAEGFRRITYYLDRPDVMARFTCKVIAEQQAYPHLLSNGNKIEAGLLENGKHYAIWQDPFPKPCYLFALVAGNFDLLQDEFVTSEGRTVALEIYVDQGNQEQAHHAMASLKHAMRWDEQTFGLAYDLDIYMIVAVDFFNMGAMENKGLNIFNSKYVLADTHSATDTDYFNIESVIAHEYFHNWTGNRVTCRDWFQLSLKEGLTVFRDQQFSADMHSAAVCRIENVRLLRSMQFAEDAGPMAHPIRPEQVLEMNNFYTLTVYEKGAEVIRMLHTLLAADKFRSGMDLYFKRHDGQAVTCDDFVNAMSDASGLDLTLFKTWYSQSGTPELRVEKLWQPDTNTLTISIQQHTPSSASQPEKLPLHIPIRLELVTANEQDNVSTLLALTAEQQSWQFKQLATEPVVSLLGGFSAPVKVNFPLSEQALETIMLYANDEYSRWDASQQIFSQHIKQLVIQPDHHIPNSLLAIVEHLLQSNADKALIAEQLCMPSFDEMLDQFEQVDPVSLVDAIEQLKLYLATGLEHRLSAVYQQCNVAPYQRDGAAMAQRRLKNVCLSYLALLPTSSARIAQQFDQADNMTDTLAAMKAAAVNDMPEFTRQMSIFEKHWYDSSLVMDKWFTMAATVAQPDIFERLEQLTQHALFSLKNPNRARALIGAFVQGNPKYFHCKSGRGYQWLAAQIALLNDINPQVASRLITPLIQFSHLDEQRQTMIKAQLVTLRQLDRLSKDLLEKLNAVQTE